MHALKNFALIFASLILTGAVGVVAYDVYMANQYHRLIAERARLLRVVERRLAR
ncbi:MAG: hypothetical protein ABSA32_09165 [Candidatus Acidiferrales bacterium]|jgi:CHASE3 domain sensor protein